MPEKRKSKDPQAAHQDDLLDEGIEETFAPSDPVSAKRVSCQGDPDREAAADVEPGPGGAKAALLERAHGAADRARLAYEDSRMRAALLADEVRHRVTDRPATALLTTALAAGAVGLLLGWLLARPRSGGSPPGR